MLDRQMLYWRTQLAGLSPLELPTDHPYPAVRHRSGGVVPFVLDAPSTAALRKTAQQEGVTLFMMLLAAFQWQLGGTPGRTTWRSGRS